MTPDPQTRLEVGQRVEIVAPGFLGRAPGVIVEVDARKGTRYRRVFYKVKVEHPDPLAARPMWFEDNEIAPAAPDDALASSPDVESGGSTP